MMANKTYTFELFKEALNEFYKSKSEFTPRDLRRRMEALSTLRDKPLSPCVENNSDFILLQSGESCRVYYEGERGNLCSNKEVRLAVSSFKVDTRDEAGVH